MSQELFCKALIMYNFKQLKGMFSQNRRTLLKEKSITGVSLLHKTSGYCLEVSTLVTVVLRTSFTTLKDPIMYLGSRYASAMEFFMSKQLTAKTRILFLQKSSIIEVSQGLY